jgi:hypothetical protein
MVEEGAKVSLKPVPQQQQPRFPRLPQLDSIPSQPLAPHPPVTLSPSIALLRAESIVTAAHSMRTSTARETNDISTTCLYQGRRCMGRRASKLNGDLHRFCQYHRIKANAVQMRSSIRRKKVMAVSGKAVK